MATRKVEGRDPQAIGGRRVEQLLDSQQQLITRPGGHVLETVSQRCLSLLLGSMQPAPLAPTLSLACGPVICLRLSRRAQAESRRQWRESNMHGPIEEEPARMQSRVRLPPSVEAVLLMESA